MIKTPGFQQGVPQGGAVNQTFSQQGKNTEAGSLCPEPNEFIIAVHHHFVQQPGQLVRGEATLVIFQ